MISGEKCSFEELTALKKEHDLEILLRLYDDIKLEKFKIIVDDKVVGIILCEDHRDGICIEYFEIFKKERHKELGRKIISELLGEEKENVIYVNSLPERINFWKKCGFTEYERNAPAMLRYKSDVKS